MSTEQADVKVEIDAELFDRLLAHCLSRGIDLEAVIESRCELHLARAEAAATVLAGQSPS